MRFHIDRTRDTGRAWMLLLAVACIGIPTGCDDKDAPATGPPATGEIAFSIVKTGKDTDADGFVVMLDHVRVAQLSAASADLTFTVNPGTHTVELADVASNCTVIGENPRSVGVASKGRSAAFFAVDCPRLGSLVITTETTGQSLDTDGYELSIDGTSKGALGPKDEAHIDGLRPDFYSVRLSSVAANCFVQPVTFAGDGRTRAVQITEGETVTIAFEVSCIARPDDAPGEKLVISAWGFGDHDSNLYLSDIDGSGAQRVTDDPGNEMMPEFSPDGERILFLKTLAGARPVLAILDRATRQETTLPTQFVERAIWSPDGTRIAFVRGGQLFLMASDGTGEILLTTGSDARDPYWSPDGTQIAFTRGTAVYLVSVAGKQVSALTSSSEMYAAGPWSPDGRRLIVTKLDCSYDYYYYGCYYGPQPSDLQVLDIQTLEVRQLTTTPLQAEWSPVWAADGRRVFYIGLENGNQDVFTTTFDSDPLVTQRTVNLTSSAARENWISIGNVRSSISSSIRSKAVRR